MFSRIYNNLNLYRRRYFWASGAALLVLLALTASSAPYQRRVPHKLRATALVEVATDAKGIVTTHVIPIAILANGSVHDASIYESRPRPMALGNGVVYEAQKTGIPVGYAKITNGSNTQQGWIGLGRWESVSEVEAKEKARPKPKSSSPTAAPDDRPILHREGQTPQPTPTPTPDQSRSSSGDSDRPVIHRGGGASPEPTPVPAPDETQSVPSDSGGPVLHRSGGQSPQSTPTPASSPTPGQSQQGSSDGNRPVLHRSGDESPQATPTPGPSPTPDQTQQGSSDSDRPVLHRSGDSGSDQQNSGGSTQSGAQTASQPPAQTEPEPPPDPNRPVLRHRRPGETDDTETAQAAASKTTTPAVTSTPGKPAQSVTTSSSPGTQTFVAVSDEQSSDSRSYEYHWKPDEQPQIEAKMRKLALDQLPGGEAQANEHAMTNVVIRSFDLDLSNDAVVVITAEVPGSSLAPKPAPKAGKTSRAAAKSTAPKPSEPKTEQKPVSRYVAVIARVDIDGNPQKLAASVTDSSRLDVAPRLELIDAVDVDGDGLAELLFREYDFDQKTFIVYGVGHGTVTKVFEGASEPIK